MKNIAIILFNFLCFGSFWVFAQVPADQVSNPENIPAESPALPVDDSMSLPVGFLSDPDELALIEGLDEPMERLKLRDQDTNMIEAPIFQSSCYSAFGRVDGKVAVVGISDM